MSKNNEFVGSTPLLFCNGYLLDRIVIPNVKFVYRLSGHDKFGNAFTYIKWSSINTPRQPYFLQNNLDGSGNKTIYIGSKASIYFSLKSTYTATSALSFSITASTSPAELMLKYQITVTVKPNDTKILVISIETKDTDMKGDYVVKVSASSEELTLMNSQSVTLVKVNYVVTIISMPLLSRLTVVSRMAGRVTTVSYLHGRLTLIECSPETNF